MTQAVESPVVDLNATVACATDRAKGCPNKVEFYVILSCCDEQSPLCGPHARQGMAEWDKPAVVMGIATFICGYCNASPMPRPKWRKI